MTTSSQESLASSSEPRAPLDHDHGTVEVEVEVVEQGGAAEPVGVDVHERRAAGEVRVGAREHEGGALHRPPHAEAVADAAGQRGLARAERAGEQHEVAGAQPAREFASERLHRGGVGRLDAHHAASRRGPAPGCAPPVYVRATRGPIRVTIS